MSTKTIEVVSIADHEDGSCTVEFWMSVDALKTFAAIGLHQVLVEKAKEITDGHSDAERTADADSGETGGTDFLEQFPGL